MDELDDIIYEYETSTMNSDELSFKLASYLLNRIEGLEEEVTEWKRRFMEMEKNMLK